MDFDAPVKLDLDTKQATQKARELERARVRSRKRQHEAANRRNPISGKLAKFAGGIGGYTAVTRMMSSGAGPSPWGAWQQPLVALAQQHIDSVIGYSARARMTALAHTEKKLAFASRPGQSLEPAREFFRRDLRIQSEVEAGRNILRADPRFSGVNFLDLLQQSIGGYFDLLLKSFGYMAEAFGK